MEISSLNLISQAGGTPEELRNSPFEGEKKYNDACPCSGTAFKALRALDKQ
jgi:hypothetical protein